MKLQTRLLSLFGALAVASTPLAMADNNRTTATIVGAAVGGAVGNVAGNSTSATLLSAAAGGLLGNLLAQNSSNYGREGYYNQRYYYGGREFRRRQDYLAYREAVRRNMLHQQERDRYAHFTTWHRDHIGRNGPPRHPGWQQPGRPQAPSHNRPHRPVPLQHR